MMKNISVYLLIVLQSLIFVSCGGGGGSSSPLANPSKSVTISGKVIDGYIKDAYVCLDINSNGICEDSEVNTISLDDGSYSFPSITISTNIITVLSKGGFDISAEKSYEGELTSILDTSTLSTQNVVLNLNPFTDLLGKSYINTKDKTINTTLKNKISNIFSIVTLDLNPMQDKYFFSKVQELEHIKNILEVIVLKYKDISLNDEQKIEVRNKIKNSIIKSITQTSNNTLETSSILTDIENEFTIEISENEKTFIINQISQTKSILQMLTSNTSILNSELSQIQYKLSNDLLLAYNKLEDSESSDILEVEELISTRKEINKNLLNFTSLENENYDTPPSVPVLE